jgi:hypothetical protein
MFLLLLVGVINCRRDSKANAMAPFKLSVIARSIIQRQNERSERYSELFGISRHSSVPFLSRRRRTVPGFHHPRRDQLLTVLEHMRGGSTEAEEATESAMDSAEVVEAEEDDEKETETEPVPKKSSPQLPPVSIVVQSNTGTPLLDYVLELPLVNRNRNIASIKQSVSRQWPAKPPISTIQLVYQGQRLTDDNLLIADLLEDDDDDDDDDDVEGESDGKKLVFYLDMIPPVDPKTFLSELDSKLNDVTTAELLNAYAINEAALYYNSIVLAESSASRGETDLNGDAPVTSSLSSVSARIRERATQLQQDWQESVLDTPHAQKLLSEAESPAEQRKHAAVATAEVRGQRVRYTGISGLQGQTKRLVQHQFNIEDWPQTFKHCLLFLFFGWFGGRTTLSRTILLLGAPGIFLLQARSIKSYWRRALYALLDHPPAIVLSLFPAPQQAILSLNVASALQTLYGPHVERTAALLDCLDEDEVLLESTTAETIKSKDVDEDDEEEDEYDDEDDDLDEVEDDDV